MALSDWASNSGGQIMTKPAGATNAVGQERIVEYYDPVTGLNTGEMRKERYLYNNTGAATVVGDVYMVTFSATLAQSPQVIVCATTTPLRNLVVAVEVVAAGAYGWFAVAGPVNASLEATTDIVAGNFLKLTAATSALAFIQDGSSETTSSHAIAVLGITTNGVNRPTTSIPNKVYLLGHRATVA